MLKTLKEERLRAVEEASGVTLPPNELEEKRKKIEQDFQAKRG